MYVPLPSKKIEKTILIMILKDKWVHNIMLYEAIKLRGLKSIIFENVPSNLALNERMTEKVYNKFYKHIYEDKSFNF